MKNKVSTSCYLLILLFFVSIIPIEQINAQSSDCEWNNGFNPHQTPLHSNGTNTKLWDGTTWSTPYSIPWTDADRGGTGAPSCVAQGWALVCGSCAIGGQPTESPWWDLYRNQACWVSSSQNDFDNPDPHVTKYFKHDFNHPDGMVAFNPVVKIHPDDTVWIFYDPTSNDPTNWVIGSASNVGRVIGYCSPNPTSITLPTITGGNHTIGFILKKAKDHKHFGMIYTVDYDTVPACPPNITFNETSPCCYNFSFVHGSNNNINDNLTKVTIQITGGTATFLNASLSGTAATYNWQQHVINSTNIEYTGGTPFNIGWLVSQLEFCIDNPTGQQFDYLLQTWHNQTVMCRVQGKLTCESPDPVLINPCQSLAFNGTNSWVDLPSNNEYIGSEGFTWEFWFNLPQALDASSGNKQVMISIDPNYPGGYKDAYIGFGAFGVSNSSIPPRIGGDSLVFKVDGNSETMARDATSSPLAWAPQGGFLVNKWYHVAGVRTYNPQDNENAMELFVDGIMVASSHTLSSDYDRITPPYSPSLGRWDGGSMRYFKGNLDEIRFWNRPLSAMEIHNNMNLCLTPPLNGLIAYYPIYENESPAGTIIDTTSNQLDGIISNTTWENEYADLNCCKNCCDNLMNKGFDKLNSNSTRVLFQNGNELVELLGLLKVQNEHISRVSVSIESASIRKFSWSGWYHDWEPAPAEFVRVSTTTNPLDWQPHSYPSPTCGGSANLGGSNGLPGVSGSPYCSEYPFGREFIWGGYNTTNLLNSIDMTNGCQLAAMIKFPAILYNGQFLESKDSLKFSIRYQFTDSTCCTCDTLVHYTMLRQRRNRHILDEIQWHRYFKMESMTEGIITIINPTKAGDDDEYVINNLKVNQPILDKEVLENKPYEIVSIEEVSSAKTGSINNGIADIDIILKPGEQTDIKLKYDNPNNLYILPHDINLSVEFKKAPGIVDNPIYERVYGVVPGAGGDSLTQDKVKDMKDVYTVAIDFRNANKAKKGIATLELIPVNGEILIAGTSEKDSSINLSFNRTTQVPVGPRGDYEDKYSIEPDSGFNSIYVTLRKQGVDDIIINYKTYDENDVLISEGLITAQPTTAVKEEGEDTGLINGINLNDCYPNSTSGDVTFSFFSTKNINNVNLVIYNTKGDVVAKVLENSSFGTGNHVIMYNVSMLPSGVYYYKLESGTYSETKLLNVIR